MRVARRITVLVVSAASSTAGDTDAAHPAAHPAALGDDERADLLAVLNSQRFVDRSAAQIWAILLDEGVYLASHRAQPGE